MSNIEQKDPFRAMMEHMREDRLAHFRVQNELALKGKTLFTGSSLMEQFPIGELLMNHGMHTVVYNRGIGGFTTQDMLAHMEEQIFGVQPGRIFINIGTNDIGAPGYRQEALIENYRNILKQIKERLPETEIILMAYYPVNELAHEAGDPMLDATFKTRTNENIQKANAAVCELAHELGCRFIDVNQGLAEETGRLKKEYTIEGIHMYANGYEVVFRNMKPYLQED